MKTIARLPNQELCRKKFASHFVTWFVRAGDPPLGQSLCGKASQDWILLDGADKGDITCEACKIMLERKRKKDEPLFNAFVAGFEACWEFEGEWTKVKMRDAFERWRNKLTLLAILVSLTFR